MNLASSHKVSVNDDPSNALHVDLSDDCVSMCTCVV